MFLFSNNKVHYLVISRPKDDSLAAPTLEHETDNYSDALKFIENNKNENKTYKICEWTKVR